MRRVITAREQVEMLDPWVRKAARPGLRLPKVRGDWLDRAGLTQDFFRRNQYSWIDSLTPEEIALGSLWYPVGHEWGEHMGGRHGMLPYKVHAVVAATSPQRRWISKNLGRNSNLGDAHSLISSPPGSVTRLDGISGSSNLRKAIRVLAAPDDRDAVLAAFLGHDKHGRPNSIKGAEKTHAFLTTLDDPTHGGPGNYMSHLVVNDSWNGRAGLFSREQWDRAKLMSSRTNRPMRDFLKWPGKGTGKGLDKPTDNKKFNPATGRWELQDGPPSLSEIAARVIGKGGAYGRLSNATRAAAARHGLDYAHEAQAAIWAAISGNENRFGTPAPGVDLHSMGHPEELWNEMWARRSSGLIAPRDPGGLVPPGHHREDDDEDRF